MVIHDEIGPETVVEVYDSKTGLHGFLVIDNTKMGVGKGGLRVAQGLSVDEIFRLARAMTFKNTISELPFGGAKSGLMIPKNVSKDDAVRWFAKKLKSYVPEQYVFGPDMSTGEKEMDIVSEVIGTRKASTGKSQDNGGLPHELGSTGYGVSQSTFATLKFLKHDLEGISVAIEGFGNVGTFTMKFLTEAGLKVVAVSDSKGTIYDKDGLDYEKLMSVKQKTGSVLNYENAKKLEAKDLFSLDVDILIPGARPDSINDKNAELVKADVIVEAGNIPMQVSLEERFHQKGVVVIPDFVANAGGVISSWVEYENNEKTVSQAVVDRMFKEVKKRVHDNTLHVLERADKDAVSPRRAAMKIVNERLDL